MASRWRRSARARCDPERLVLRVVPRSVEVVVADELLDREAEELRLLDESRVRALRDHEEPRARDPVGHLLGEPERREDVALAGYDEGRDRDRFEHVARRVDGHL